MCLPHTPALPRNPVPCTPVPHTPALPTPQAQLWLLFRVVLDGPALSMTLHNLTVGPEYLVSVLPVGEAGVGKGLGGLVTTGGWGGIMLGFGGHARQQGWCRAWPGLSPPAVSLGLPDPRCPLLSCLRLLWVSCPLGWPRAPLEAFSRRNSHVTTTQPCGVRLRGRGSCRCPQLAVE